MTMLRTLSYSSTPTRDFSEDDIARLAARSRSNNALDGVTGLLLYNGHCFSQIIEGSPAALEDLWGRLLADERHRDVTMRAEGDITTRVFATWDMHALFLPSDRARADAQVEERLLQRAGAERREAVRAVLDFCFA